MKMAANVLGPLVGRPVAPTTDECEDVKRRALKTSNTPTEKSGKRPTSQSATPQTATPKRKREPDETESPRPAPNSREEDEELRSAAISSEHDDLEDDDDLSRFEDEFEDDGGNEEPLSQQPRLLFDEFCAEEDDEDDHTDLSVLDDDDDEDEEEVELEEEEAPDRSVSPNRSLPAVARELVTQALKKVTSVDEEEDEYEEAFDPYLFMKLLPQNDTRDLRRVLPKERSASKSHTLVLDLDETLVHSQMDPVDDADFAFGVDLGESTSTVYVRLRPHLSEFLAAVAERFEVVVFTASHRAYAQTLLDRLDPEGVLFDHRLFRESCSNVDGLYLKDLDRLGRDLSKTAIVDNTPYVFAYQPDNAIPIDSWYDDEHDTALKDLLPFLDHLAQTDDVRPLLSHTFKLRHRINMAS